MNKRSRDTMVRAALSGSDADTEELLSQCTDKAAAKEIADLLLATLPRHAHLIEAWLQAIAEMHADLAAPIGRELLRRRPSAKESGD